MEINIPPPEGIEAEYRIIVTAFIAGSIRIALSFAEDSDGLNRNSISNLIAGLRARANTWLSDGVNASGVVTIASRGAGNTAIRRVINATERNQRARLIDLVTRAGGSQVTRLLTRARYESIIRSTIARNVELIRDVTNQQQLLLEDALLQAWIQPDLRGEPLIEKIEGIQGRGRNRAALIANNEIGSLHSVLQQRRFEDIGIEEYVWRTSQDERVRDRHIELNGQTFAVGEPTGAEDGLPPGSPIRCRCVAIATFAVDNNA